MLPPPYHNQFLCHFPRFDTEEAKKENWKLPDMADSIHLKSLRLPESMDFNRVVQLIYTNSGTALIALSSSGIHNLWVWHPSEHNPSGKSVASIIPQLWKPRNGDVMTNYLRERNPSAKSASCIALSKNDYYLVSGSGGKVSLFNTRNFRVMATFIPPPPAATCLAFHPHDNNIVAIGREDSSILIYNARCDKIIMELRGHQKQITGLAFSRTSLVSSGADAHLCIWDIIGWEKRKSIRIQSPPGHYPPALVGETQVQFHNDQRHLLVVHESQIAIYNHQLECLKLWSPREPLCGGISSATYSCNGLLLFTGFLDGAVGVFDADTLRLRYRIAPSAYLSTSISSFGSSNSTPYPIVIAAHPTYSNQFSLGMSDGSVHVIEPAHPDPKLESPAPVEKVTLASSMLKDKFENLNIRDI